jgi:hypothetical protein
MATRRKLLLLLLLLCEHCVAWVILFISEWHKVQHRSVWLLRNKALHGDESTTLLLSYMHTQLLLGIQDIYDQADSMLAADRRLFVHPYTYWLDKPTTELKTFLKRMWPTVKARVAQAADMGTHFRSIDSYL